MKDYRLAAKLLAQVTRAGARHSASDNTLIQQAHDILCDLGAECKVSKAEALTVDDLRRYAPNPMLKAAVEALVMRHPGHPNQKTHGNRFGAGQAKESLRRLKDDKGARERYKETARKKTGVSSSKPDFQSKKIKTGSFIKARGTSFTGLVSGYGTAKVGKENIPVYKVRTAGGRTSIIPVHEARLITNSEAIDS